MNGLHAGNVDRTIKCGGAAEQSLTGGQWSMSSGLAARGAAGEGSTGRGAARCDGGRWTGLWGSGEESSVAWAMAVGTNSAGKKRKPTSLPAVHKNLGKHKHSY